jgi:hypothetical protein
VIRLTFPIRKGTVTHLLKKLFEIGLRDSVPSGYDSLSELVVAPETVIIVLFMKKRKEVIEVRVLV